jgi:hypothetical protein
MNEIKVDKKTGGEKLLLDLSAKMERRIMVLVLLHMAVVSLD